MKKLLIFICTVSFLFLASPQIAEAAKHKKTLAKTRVKKTCVVAKGKKGKHKKSLNTACATTGKKKSKKHKDHA